LSEPEATVFNVSRISASDSIMRFGKVSGFEKNRKPAEICKIIQYVGKMHFNNYIKKLAN